MLLLLLLVVVVVFDFLEGVWLRGGWRREGLKKGGSMEVWEGRAGDDGRRGSLPWFWSVSKLNA